MPHNGCFGHKEDKKTRYEYMAALIQGYIFNIH